jgi:hypothetical protein
MRCDVYSVESQTIFRRNMSPPSSGLKSKPTSNAGMRLRGSTTGTFFLLEITTSAVKGRGGNVQG